MKFVTRVVSFFSLISCAISAHAGWYVVHNYEGRVGGVSVHVSLQSYSFGPGQNLEGSYYYDSHRAPIPLYGRAMGSTISLCEVHNAAEFDKHINVGSSFSIYACPFQLTKSGDHLRGVWQDAAHRYDVELKEVGMLNDTSSTANIQGKLVIPFWGQTATHSFFGVYEKVGGSLTVDHIDVVNKRTGRIDQVIWTGKTGKAEDQESRDCYFGFYKTPIYMNIQSGVRTESIDLSCFSNSPDHKWMLYSFDPKTRRYRSYHVGM